MNNQFLKDVIDGLSNSPQKTLPSKYFYDKKGDDLFVQIMNMPEYYLTNAEMDILQNKSLEIISSLHLSKNTRYELIELGAGDGTKTVHLLETMLKEGYTVDYLPVDISEHALIGVKNMLQDRLPDLRVKSNHGDYFEILEQLSSSPLPKIVLFLGSNMGNLLDEKAHTFVHQLGSNLKAGDQIILGVDLIKPKKVVLPAYNDAKGITAEFNLNLLDRINNELDGDFNRSNFEHAPEYDENEGIAKSFLRSRIKQEVTISGKIFSFEEGETIHTEISRKYNDEILKKILSNTDITISGKVMDSKELFADYLLKRN